MKLTKRQADTLDFIKQYSAKNGYPPTVREIAKKLMVSSPATIHTHLAKLAEKGLIKKDLAKNRAIEILVPNEYLETNEQTTNIPLLGVVTAGNPIEAIEQSEEFIPIATDYLKKNKEFFALRVRGDSMINVGIYDDDVVLVERDAEVKNGDLAIAMTDDGEVTLKTFYQEKDHVRLQPENDDYEPIILTEGKLLGKAYSLYRKL